MGEGARGDVTTAPPDLRHAYIVLAVVGVASFITALSLSIVFVVYPALVEAFPDASTSKLSWTINIFTIVGAPLLVFGSYVSERTGRRRTLVLAIVGFGVTSIVSAMASGPGWLIIGRALQAICTSFILPTSATLIMREFPEELRGSAAAGWSAIGGVAASLGPSLGGWLVETWGWRAAFWLNVPICAVSAIAAYLFLDESRGDTDRRIPDIVGMLCIMAGVGMVVFGLVQSPRWGWANGWIIASIVGGIAVLVYLVHRSGHHPSPVIDLTLFRLPSYVVGNFSMLFFAISFFGVQFVAVQFLTKVWGYRIVDAGLLMTPVLALTALLSIVAGRLSDRIGDAKLAAPAVGLWTVGMIVLVFTLRAERNLTLWFVGVSLAGIGSGLSWGGVFALVLRNVEATRLSIASSIVQTTQRIGNALGVATAVTVLGRALDHSVGDYRRAIAALAVASALAVCCNLWLANQSRPRSRTGVR